MIKLIVLYLVFGSGMIWGYTQSKKNPRKPLPKLASIISAIAICIIAASSNIITAGPDRLEIEQQFRRSYLVKLGQDLASRVDGNGKALVIHNYQDNNVRSKEQLARSLEYLSEGFAGRASIAKIINPHPVMKEDDMMMEEVSGEELNAIITSNNDCNIVVFLSSLPYAQEELLMMEVFYTPLTEGQEGYEEEQDDPPFPGFDESKLPVVGLSVGSSIRELKPYIEMGRIDSAVAWNPSKDFSQGFTEPDNKEDLNSWFAQRYLLVNTNNVDQVSAQHPKLFVSPKKK